MMRALRLNLGRAMHRVFGRSETAAAIEGWRLAGAVPAVKRDLMTMGHFFETDQDPATGRLYANEELQARAARRSFALVILGRMGTTHDELNQILMEDNYENDDAE